MRAASRRDPRRYAAALSQKERAGMALSRRVGSRLRGEGGRRQYLLHA